MMFAIALHTEKLAAFRPCSGNALSKWPTLGVGGRPPVKWDLGF